MIFFKVLERCDQWYVETAECRCIFFGDELKYVGFWYTISKKKIYIIYVTFWDIFIETENPRLTLWIWKICEHEILYGKGENTGFSKIFSKINGSMISEVNENRRRTKWVQALSMYKNRVISEWNKFEIPALLSCK